ncbi:MAG: hypothetical protein E7575_02695 [Ruminococcaceae bacterium]|nr:hypothetical protein [Oscillospiraceae bacterium]
MTKSKLVGIAAAALIIIAGAVYLHFGEKTLIPVLALCTAAVLIMGAVSAAESKKQGLRGIIAYIPAICYGALSAFIIAALIYLCL